MSLTSKVLLQKYKKKDGSQAIIIRFTLNRKSFEVTTGHTVEAKYWNEQKGEIKPNCPTIKNVGRLNKMIAEQRSLLLDRILVLIDSKEIKEMSLAEVKKAIIDSPALSLDHKSNKSILDYSQSLIDELRQAGRVGNARVYKTMRNSLISFLSLSKQNDMPLMKINHDWLKSYEAWYLGKGNSINGLSVHLRTLRSTLNRAILSGLLSKENYAFENYSIKTQKTKKRAISEADVELLKNFKPTTSQQQRAKDYFFMSFYLMGASFVDLAFLKLSNINNGRIEYRRKKTAQLHSIKITPALKEILDKYIDGKKSSDFILNVIKAKDKSAQHVQARNELKRVNKRIKDIGKLCGISQPLTSYVARHTYATIANTKDVPLSIISQSLGHKDQKTTAIYLAQFGSDVMDRYNNLITGQ